MNKAERGEIFTGPPRKKITSGLCGSPVVDFSPFSVSEVSVCDCPITHGLAGFHALSCVIEACGS